ncbi:CRISPR-associated protein Cas5 [Sulfobacillus thermosulfidooxidans]|uniref:CRISPR-associated protein Cas5 n=1 Tax=Sulfobacillus thermosulfidooxidans TaxID=28034 RepID=UPI0006B46216|nr:CRISPR-associated protein Cas5 [Sulfobacillus thermosulfidooxidans]
MFSSSLPLPETFIVFDVSGSMAQFREPDTNAVARTFPLPPRPTVLGILAAILGYDRNSYYDDILSPTKCWVHTECLTPYHTVVQKVQRFQNNPDAPINFVTEQFLRPDTDTLRYRFWIGLRDRTIAHKLLNRIHHHQPVYPISLGPAYCLATLHDAVYATAHITQDAGPVWGLVPVDTIQPGSLKLTPSLITLTLPYHFTAQREGTNKRFLYDVYGHAIDAAYTVPRIQLSAVLHHEEVSRCVIFPESAG